MDPTKSVRNVAYDSARTLWVKSLSNFCSSQDVVDIPVKADLTQTLVSYALCCFQNVFCRAWINFKATRRWITIMPAFRMRSAASYRGPHPTRLGNMRSEFTRAELWQTYRVYITAGSATTRRQHSWWSVIDGLQPMLAFCILYVSNLRNLLLSDLRCHYQDCKKKKYFVIFFASGMMIMSLKT